MAVRGLQSRSQLTFPGHKGPCSWVVPRSAETWIPVPHTATGPVAASGEVTGEGDPRRKMPGVAVQPGSEALWAYLDLQGQVALRP